tara:strand:- start:1450 stop:1722 length:273 start_codon:yes stop_codon:yes gene_type:complete
MYKKIKVKPNKSQGFKVFEIEVKEPNLQERAKLNDALMDNDSKQNFTFFLGIIKEHTRYSDEELNDYSLEELVAMSTAIIESANKKKLKK